MKLLFSFIFVIIAAFFFAGQTQAFICSSEGWFCCDPGGPYPSNGGSVYCYDTDIGQNVGCGPCTSGEVCYAGTGTCNSPCGSYEQVCCGGGVCDNPAVPGENWGLTCSGGTCGCTSGDHRCNGTVSQFCSSSSHRFVDSWNCQWGCNAETGECLPAPNEYCETFCSGSMDVSACTSQDKHSVYCWNSYDPEYLDWLDTGFPAPYYGPECITTSNCGCTATWSRCCTSTDPGCNNFSCPHALDSDPYEYIDSCNGLDCRVSECPGQGGPPDPTATPTGPTPTLAPSCPQPFSGWVGDASLDPGQVVQVACNYSDSSLDCVIPLLNSQDSRSPWASCSWDTYSGNDALFNCTAIGTPGSYSHLCTTFSGSASNCTAGCVGQDGAVTINAPASVPNCQNVRIPPGGGSSVITLGESRSFTADCSSPDGNLSCELFYDLQGAPYTMNTISNQSLPGTSATMTSASWTPAAGGTYNVCCRAWNDGVAECRPPNYIDGSLQYNCAGPGYCMTVSVATPTPTPWARLRARAVVEDTSSCSTIQGSTNYGSMDGTVFNLSLGQPNQTQDGSSHFASWGAIPGGVGRDYTIVPNPPTANYAYRYACLYNTTQSTLISQDQNVIPLSNVGIYNDDDQFSWFVAYTPAGPWFQTEEGDVYAQGSITSPVTQQTPTQTLFFNRFGGGNYPGAVTYGPSASYDFSVETSNTGSDRISIDRSSNPINWIVQDSRTTVNLYDYYYLKLGAPTTPTSASQSISSADLNSCTLISDASPYRVCYYTNANIHNSNEWDIGTRKIIILASGSVTFDYNVAIDEANGGFLAVIAQNGITVSTIIGDASNRYTAADDLAVEAAADLEGLYITNGTFVVDGDSSNNRQFILKGSVIASSTNVKRSLGLDNIDYPAGIFLFEPRYLFTMPQALQDTSVRWEEIAP